MSIAEKFEVIADAVYEKGKKAQTKEFWGKLQNYGGRTNYTDAFSSVIWNDNIYDPQYPIVTTLLVRAFRNSNVTDTKVPIDVTNSSGAALNSAFDGSKLVKIKELIVTNKITYVTTFRDCSALVDITFTGEIGQNLDLSDSPLLSEATLTNIVDHLAIVSVATTLTLHATAKAKLTDTQKATIQEKGWTFDE